MKEIVICPRCDGYGKYKSRTSYKYEIEINECERCGGNGKLLKTTTIEFSKINDNIIDRNDDCLTEI